MTEDPFSQEEHEAFMRRAIYLGAKGGIQERTGGNALKFDPANYIIKPTDLEISRRRRRKEFIFLVNNFFHSGSSTSRRHFL